MKAVIQRVKSASVTVDNEPVASTGRGVMVLVAVGKGDDEKEADGLIGRVLRSQLWPDDNETEWQRNVRDVEGEILCVSQFTLYTQLKQGNESDFEEAADIETARRLYDYFYRGLREAYNPERVKNGNFPAMMDGEWMNDGPVGFTFRSAHEAVTIEVNTKLPKTEKTAERKEVREERAEGEGKGRQEESGGKVEQTLEFQLPVSDVSRGIE